MSLTLAWLGAVLLPLLPHVALRVTLALCGYAPWRLDRFLEHAREVVFLRRAGGSYSFIHREFQEHFAELTDADIERLTG